MMLEQEDAVPLRRDLVDRIRERRAVHDYEPGLVSDETIRFLLDAAVHAPAVQSADACSFIVVQSPPQLGRLSSRVQQSQQGERSVCQTSAAASAASDADIFHHAGTLILVCAPIDRAGADSECWLAAENLMLTACAIGLGTCVVRSVLELLRSTEVKRELGIKASTRPVAAIVVGVCHGEHAMPLRLTPTIDAWIR